MLKRLFVLICTAMLVAACGKPHEEAAGPKYGTEPPQQSGQIYRFAIHPLYNPKKLTELYQPLIEYLNRQIKDVHFELEASRDYAVYESKFRQRDAELLLPNPWQTLEAMKNGYSVIAMAGDAENFKGIFLVRRDGNIKDPQDAKGKIVSYPSPTALAATVLPQYFLHQHGVNVNRDIDNRYVGSQESSIMHVYLKQSDIGATWPSPWRAFIKDHPQEAAQLKVIWETSSLLNNSVMVRDDVPPQIRMRVQEVLVGMQGSAEGRAILAGMETGRFHLATDADYAPVREFVRRFEREVRPIEMKK